MILVVYVQCGPGLISILCRYEYIIFALGAIWLTKTQQIVDYSTIIAQWPEAALNALAKARLCLHIIYNSGP